MPSASARSAAVEVAQPGGEASVAGDACAMPDVWTMRFSSRDQGLAALQTAGIGLRHLPQHPQVGGTGQTHFQAKW